MATCKKCGKQIPAEMKRCPYCNKKRGEFLKAACGVVSVLGTIVLAVVTKGQSRQNSSNK